MENRRNHETICLICVGFVCIYIKRGAIVPKSEAGDSCVGCKSLRHSRSLRSRAVRQSPRSAGGPKAGALGDFPACPSVSPPLASSDLLRLGRLRLIDVTGLTFCVVIRQLQGSALDVQLAPARSAGREADRASSPGEQRKCVGTTATARGWQVVQPPDNSTSALPQDAPAGVVGRSGTAPCFSTSPTPACGTSSWEGPGALGVAGLSPLLCDGHTEESVTCSPWASLSPKGGE